MCAVYLDNAATSYPKPDGVVKEMENYLKNIGASAGRGTYQRADKAAEIVSETRENLASLFNLDDAKRIIFTHNITTSINYILKGILKPGDHVITTEMEHNSVWRPLKVLETANVIELSTVSTDKDGFFSAGDFEEKIRPNTKLAAVVHGSNVTGTVFPLEEIYELLNKRDVMLLVDGAQTAGSYPVDLQKVPVDFFTFTGHKGLLGPAGTGGFYIKEGREEVLSPFMEGGTGGDASIEAQPDYLPEKYEAGTLNLPGIAGLNAAVKYLLQEGVENIYSHKMELMKVLVEGLKNIEGCEIYSCPRDMMDNNSGDNAGVISFNLKSINPEEVGYVLDEAFEIMVRTGLHCAPRAHNSIGTLDKRGTIRVGLGPFNTKEDIELLLGALDEVVKT